MLILGAWRSLGYVSLVSDGCVSWDCCGDLWW